MNATFVPREGPKLPWPVHAFGPGRTCATGCPLPADNRVHDLTQLPEQTAEQRAHDAAVLGEHEDNDA